MRKDFNLLIFNLKLIYYYCIYNHKLCEHLFKRPISMCDSNLRIALLSKRSLSSNYPQLPARFFFFSTSYSSNVFRPYHSYKAMLLSVITTIIIIIMYRSQPVCTLSIIIIKHQYPKTVFISLATDRIHTYAIRNISFNRNIISTYILRPCVNRFLICIK